MGTNITMEKVETKPLKDLKCGDFFSYVGSINLYMRIYGNLYVNMNGMTYEIENLDELEVIIYDIDINANVRLHDI